MPSASRIYSCHPSLWRRAEKKGFTPTNRHFHEGVEIARQYWIPLDSFRYGFKDPNRPRRPAPAWLVKANIRQKKGGK